MAAFFFFSSGGGVVGSFCHVKVGARPAVVLLVILVSHLEDVG